MLNKRPNTLILIGLTASLGLSSCGGGSSSNNTTNDNNTTDSETQTIDSAASICNGQNNFENIPSAYVTALTKYTTTNSQYLVNVCTQDINSDGSADFIVVESTNLPEHESVYYETGHQHQEDFDFETNIHKFSPVYDGSQTAHSAGSNMIEEQAIIMKMPIAPASATIKTATTFATIGIALNGVSFFNENAAPGDNITDELFTFDQCSGHPQNTGIYHYHVDPVCLIRDLGGSIIDQANTEGDSVYTWIEDSGNNAGLLMGFLMDGFPVYGPVGSSETDCNSAAVPSIDSYNGHSHCTGDFSTAIYHYHLKTANIGGTDSSVFWITNQFYYGEPGEVSTN
ncbi:MAG: hypothetical protein COA99_04995 [Moraxellaceae bacterium]|nr:MAG: hypothetical protein COA99_04995 [Moraxellaceae bacterium]